MLLYQGLGTVLIALQGFSLFFFLRLFFTWTILKVLIKFVTILLLFYVLVFLAMRHIGS